VKFRPGFIDETVRVVSFNYQLSDGMVSPDLTIGIRPEEKP